MAWCSTPARCILGVALVCGLTAVARPQPPNPAPFAYTPEMLGPVFDAFWSTMDQRYSYFFLKPDVDWAAWKSSHRPKLIAAKNADELATALQDSLRPLNDIHVFVVTKSGKRLETSSRTWNYNGNGKVIVEQIAEPTKCGNFAWVGKTKPDGFGYFLMVNQSAATPETVKQAVAAIRGLKGVPAFIVDLRRATGGSEPLAMEIAKLFCDQPVVYAKSKIRGGPGHTDFGPHHARTLPASPPGEAYVKPVACLLGPGCISSGEGFAKMMKALPHVTTIGLATAGASGNPGPIPIGTTGITVYHSRWVDMLPDGSTTEGRGVAPAIEVRVPAEDYKSADPTLTRALEHLRSQIATGKMP